MRKMKRFLAGVLAASMLLSTEAVSVLATEMNEVVAETAETTELAENTEEVEGTEVTETTEEEEETETTETTEKSEGTEPSETTEKVEETESTEEAESTEKSEETESTKTPEVPEELEETETIEGTKAPEAIVSEAPDKALTVAEYNDLMDFEVISVDLDEFEGEIYEADELLEMAENMPSLMSESYGLTWGNSASYYIYNRLSEDEQKLWSAMEVLYSSYLESEVDLTDAMTDFVEVQTKETITSERLAEVSIMFRYSHPQYYFLDLGISFYSGSSYAGVAYMVYDAFADGADRKAATNEISTLLETWYDEISSYDTEEEKVKAIHDLICNKVDYNHGVLEGDNAITTEEEAVYFTQSAYSVFCTDLTVCAGYTQAFTWMCSVMDIEVTSVTSYNHAWNKVKVNDNWYNVDVTWDDGTGEGNFSYRYFLKNDANIAHASHVEEEQWLAYLPDCTLDSGSYSEAGSVPEVTEKAVAPVITVTEGATGYTVEMSTTTEGADIIYTLDGKVPAEAGTKGHLYTGEFELNKTAVIRAIAVCDGYLDSEIAEGGSIDQIVYTIASGTAGTNIVWQLDSTGKLSLTGSGVMNECTNAKELPWAAYVNDITEIEIEEGITSISAYAFLGCSGFASIQLPESLTSIGFQAFSFCNGLKEVTIPGKVTLNNYAFYGSTGLEKVTIMDGVTKIPGGTFVDCTALVEIRIPKSITSIVTGAIGASATIYGYAGSVAETYAKSNGNAFVDISNTEFEVKFVTGTEEQISSVIYPKDSLIEEPVLGSRIGYEFGGWYTSDVIHDEMTKWDFENDIVTKAITLYAYWIPNVYEVTFEAGEGTVDTVKKSVTYDSAYGELPIPVRENYTFSGWYTALEDGTLVDAETIVTTAGNHTLYAVYEVTIVASGSYAGWVGSGTWKLDALGTMTVSGYAGSWYTIPLEHKNATKKLVFEEGITTIGASAFMNFVNVKEIVLPETVTSIESQAFMGCSSLTTINLPDSIIEIGDNAFCNCAALQEITLPTGLTEISAGVFSGCRLTSIEIPASVTKIGDSAFFGCSFTTVTIPDTVTEIEGYAFDACPNLETVTLPANITYIGDGLFAACEKLRAVTIPTSVTSIGKDAFRGCKALTELVIPENVQTVGEKAFEGCTGLSTIAIPKKVKSIGADAFNGCTGLTEMTIPGTVKMLGEQLFYGCSGLTSVIFEDGVETLGARAFFNCINLEYVYFADSMSYTATIFNDEYMNVHTKLISAGPENGDYDVEFGWTEEIPDYAFAGLASLQSCVIPDTVTKIGENAFMSTGLNDIGIPESVTSIGARAFINCNSLTQVYVPETVTSIGESAFTGTTTIIGVTGSAAHTYAVNNGYTFKDVLELAMKVTFVTNTEQNVETQYYFEQSSAREPVGVEKAGYTLEGWYTSADAQDETTKWDFQNDTVNESITLYAKWTPNTYNLSYDLGYEGAENIEGKSIVFDTAYGELPTPVRAGYSFNGWYTEAVNGEKITEISVYKIASDSTLYAHWTPNTYVVTFEPEGGVLDTDKKTVTYDTAYGELPIPTKEGYYFLGWYTGVTEGAKISADTIVQIEAAQTLYARWVEMVYPAQTTVWAASKPNGNVVVSWTEVEACTKYYIYRSLTGSNAYTVVAEVAKGGTSYTDTSTTSGKKYDYYVVCEYTDASGYVTKSQSETVRTRLEIQKEWLSYKAAQEYAGAEFTPTVDVKNGSYTLVKGKDYEISCVRNTGNNANTCDVTVTGIGEYIGSQTVTITERPAKLQSSMVSPIPEMIFNGSALQPDPVVTFNGQRLTKGEDYTVSYANNTDIGTAAVTITGIGHFEGEVIGYFMIRTKSMESGFVQSIAPQSYTGSAIEPEIVLKHNEVILKENVDYRISFKDNTEVGQATATIKGRGNYVGTIKVNFQIEAADLSTLENNSNVTIFVAESTETYQTPYTGTVIKPEISLALADGKILKAGKDYTVSYSNNIVPGTANITITGMGNYTGAITKTFTIGELDIKDAVVTAGKQLTVLYTPAGQRPVPRVLYNGKRLVEDRDFEVVYYAVNEAGVRTGNELSSVTDTGNYEAVLHGKGVFAGELTKAATVTVKARSLDGGNISIDNPYARIDEEGNITAYYEVLFAGQELTEETDYKVETQVSEDQNYVTYVFTGKGNYSGILTQRFQLISGDIILFSEGKYVIEDIDSQQYTGERIFPEISVVSVVDESQSLTEGVDYTVSYKYNLNVGTATVIVTGTGNCIGTMKTTFDITPCDVEHVNVTYDTNEFTYNAKTQRPTLVLMANGSTLKEGMDYTVAYVDSQTEGNAVDSQSNQTESKNVGSYQAVITLQGNYTGEKEVPYEITALPVSALQIQIPDYKFTGAAIVPDMKAVRVSLNGKVLTESEKTGLQLSCDGNNTEVSDNIAVTITGNGNFSGEVISEFNIVKKSISDEDLTISIGEQSSGDYRVEWTGEAIEPSVAIQYGNETLIDGEDYTLTYRYNTEIGTARIIISGKGNFEGTKTVYFKITGIQLTEQNCEVSVAEGEYYYDGKRKTPSVTVTMNGMELVAGVDYNASYLNNVSAGTAKVIVSGTGCYEGTIVKEFTISPKTAAQAKDIKTSDIVKQRYTGNPITPTISITMDGVKLVGGVDYTTVVLNNVDVGTATLVATGIGNYDGVLVEKRFEIYYTTITYVMNGGVNSPNNPSYYTATDSFTLSDPEPRESYNFAGWYSNAACTNRVTKVKAGTNGNLTFYAKWTPKKVYGIDVSKWQNQANSSGAINWNSVKGAGKSFAMIRLSYGTSKDSYFEYNYSGARNAGVKVGVYCYNTATTVQAAITQAQYVMAELGGRPLEYPVCLDMEGDTVGALDNATRTNIVFAFKNVVESYGYDFILYANKNWLDNYFVNDRLEPLDLWIARYCDYNLGHRYTGKGNVRMWQYTSQGTVNGISGLVDMDVCYEDYVK